MVQAKCVVFSGREDYTRKISLAIGVWRNAENMSFDGLSHGWRYKSKQIKVHCEIIIRHANRLFLSPANA